MKKYDLESISGSYSVSLAVSSNLDLFSFYQEPEVEYVEGYDGLEEEEDMEDFGGFMKDDSLMNDDYGIYFWPKAFILYISFLLLSD